MSASAASLALQVSSETVPPGGWAQIRISSAAPALVAGGRLAVSFDPSVFGPIASVAVFSSAGDAVGVAEVLGQSMNVTFTAPSAGVGQLPDLPIVTVTVPVLASAVIGTVRAITVDPSQGPWTDQNGNLYAVTATSGSVTVGGSLSIQSVAPGGGLQAPGTLVHIYGTGFTPGATVTIPGVDTLNTQFAGQNEVDVTLGGAADLMGKQVIVTNSNGSQIAFFSSIPSLPSQSPAADAIYQPLLSMQTWTSATVGFSQNGAIVLQNPNPVPVSVTLQSLGQAAPLAGEVTITIPPGVLQPFYTGAPGLGSGPDFGFNAFSTLPIHIVGLAFPTNGAVVKVGSESVPAVAPVTPSPTTPPLQQVTATPAAVSFNWQVGAAAPAPVNVSLNFAGMLQGSTLHVSVFGPGVTSPFSVTATQVTLPATITVAVNPTGLKPGTYTAAITITPEGPNGVVTTIPLSLVVNNSAFLNVSATSLALASPGNTQTTLTVTSSGDPAAFMVTASSGTSSVKWLSVTPGNGITPQLLTVNASPTGLAPGVYNGQIVVLGPNNMATVPVQFTVNSVFGFNVPSVTFSVQAGSGPSMQTDQLNNPSALGAFTASTASGGNWLSVVPGQGGAVITATPGNLAPGTYNGTIIATSSVQGPVSLPVTLAIWSQQPIFTVTPSSVTYTIPDNGSGAIPVQELQVTSAVPINLTGNFGIFSSTPLTFTTPASIRAIPYFGPPCRPNQVCEYNITLTSGTQTIVVPVTTIPTTSAAEPPFLGSIVNAASQIPAAISPGEILTIYGFGAGPSNTSGLALTASGSVATSLNGAEVLFNGQPAPMVYGSTYQANVIVPYEVANQATATITLQFGGVTSGQWVVPIAPSAPGIFTIGSAGVGPGAVLNQDSSVNSASNPAARGSVVQIYATGEGQTSPPGVTGSVIVTNLKHPLLPVTVSIGGQNAMVQYDGSSGESVSGLLQVNAVVPQTVAPGSTVPIVVSVGGVPSQSGVTIAVQ
jgi:uncharacterized protein (TIGR03437 family)